MNRGDVYDAELPAPSGSRPVVVVTRQTAIPVLTRITVAPVTGTVRGLRTEVALGPGEGLARECVASCDNLVTIPKRVLTRHRGTLGMEALGRLNSALRVALQLD